MSAYIFKYTQLIHIKRERERKIDFSVGKSNFFFHSTTTLTGVHLYWLLIIMFIVINIYVCIEISVRSVKKLKINKKKNKKTF